MIPFLGSCYDICYEKNESGMNEKQFILIIGLYMGLLTDFRNSFNATEYLENRFLFFAI